MKNIKRTHHVYAAWRFDKEAADLNKESQKGWQLVEGGSFSNKFRYDDSEVYRYVLDFNPGVEDEGRYRETFTEQGWEYINSTSNGWHYFRKPYDPALPESEYVIYTDAASDIEMKNRWIRIADIFCVILFLLIISNIIFMIITPKLGSLFVILPLLTLLLAIYFGRRNIRGAEQHNDSAAKKRRGSFFLLLTFLFLALYFVFSLYKIVSYIKF